MPVSNKHTRGNKQRIRTMHANLRTLTKGDAHIARSNVSTVPAESSHCLMDLLSMTVLCRSLVSTRSAEEQRFSLAFGPSSYVAETTRVSASSNDFALTPQVPASSLVSCASHATTRTHAHRRGGEGLTTRPNPRQALTS